MNNLQPAGELQGYLPLRRTLESQWFIPLLPNQRTHSLLDYKPQVWGRREKKAKANGEITPEQGEPRPLTSKRNSSLCSPQEYPPPKFPCFPYINLLLKAQGEVDVWIFTHHLLRWLASDIKKSTIIIQSLWFQYHECYDYFQSSAYSDLTVAYQEGLLAPWMSQRVSETWAFLFSVPTSVFLCLCPYPASQ